MPSAELRTIDPMIISMTAARVELGISQRAVARAMGTTQSAVSEFERGITQPYLSTLKRYCKVLGYDVALVAASDEEVSDAL